MFLVFKAKKGPMRWVSKHILVFNNFNTLNWRLKTSFSSSALHRMVFHYSSSQMSPLSIFKST